jgi:plastocyanin
MIWHWAIFSRGFIFFSRLIFFGWVIFSSLSLGLPQAVRAAGVTGEVELTNSKDAAVRKRKDYSGVVLWLEPVERAVPPSGNGRRVEMLQKDKHFIPHVLAIPVGGTVDFPNADPIYHNAFSNFSGQPFDVGLYPPGTSKSFTFKHPGMVRVFCNIHSTMSAIIAVLPTQWYVVTEYSGKYTMPNVPPGDYQLRIFHERALPENLQFLERRITVSAGGLTLPLISISETGFIPVQHLNKFGRDYPPPAADGSTYPGAPRQ